MADEAILKIITEGGGGTGGGAGGGGGAEGGGGRRPRTPADFDPEEAAILKRVAEEQRALVKEFYDRMFPEPHKAFDPVMEAQKQEEAARRKAEVKKAREDIYGITLTDKDIVKPKIVNPPEQKNFLAELVNALRGTIGGVFGKAAGAGADIFSAMKGMGGEEGGAAGGGAGGALAAIPVIGAVVAGLVLLSEGIKKTAAAFGKFAVGLVSPDDNPASMVENIGGFVKGLGDAVPILGTFVSVLGTAISTVGQFMRAMDGMVERYAAFSPELAQAQAMADIVQVMGDFRRAQEVTPELLQYLQTRTEMQQKFEDAKIRFIQKMMPTAIKVMEMTEKLLPLVEVIVDIISAILNLIPGVGDKVDEIRKKMDKDDTAMDFQLPTDIILNQRRPVSPFKGA